MEPSTIEIRITGIQRDEQSLLFPNFVLYCVASTAAGAIFGDSLLKVLHAFKQRPTINYKCKSLSMCNGKRNRLTPFEMLSIDKALCFITEHFRTSISAEGLALEVNLPKEKLQAGFRKKTTLTLHQYIVLIRINKSKELLIATDFPLKAIARSVGFSDMGYYCKVFRKLEGTSPTTFRYSQVS